MSTTTATKTLRTSVAAGTNCPAGTPVTGTEINLATALGGTATAKITNGATGPTVGCTAKLMISGDGGTTWKTHRQFTAGVAANGNYEWTVEVPAGVMRARWDFSGNTGQAVTVEGFIQELTSLATA